MINRLNVASIYVLDKEEALDFYVNKLGLEKGNDVRQGDYRWLTVAFPASGDRDLAGAAGPAAARRSDRRQLRELVTKGALGGLVFITDDARALYETLKAARRHRLHPGAHRPLLRHRHGHPRPLRQRHPDPAAGEGRARRRRPKQRAGPRAPAALGGHKGNGVSLGGFGFVAVRAPDGILSPHDTNAVSFAQDPVRGLLRRPHAERQPDGWQQRQPDLPRERLQAHGHARDRDHARSLCAPSTIGADVINERFDVYVIPFANAFRISFAEQLARYTSVIES